MALGEKIEAQQTKYFAAMDQLVDQTVVKHARLSEIYRSLYELVGAQISYSIALRAYAQEVVETEQAERYLTRAVQVEAEVGTVFPTLLGYYSRRVLSPGHQSPADHQSAALSFEASDDAHSARALEQTMEYALTERERTL